jgi:beta,beta-carotene 9',10'-dioxygenase
MEHATKHSKIKGFGDAIPRPFRWSQQDREELPVRVTGALPDWLKGQLMRTAPAQFARNGMPIDHWFDGHALMYTFELGQGVHFRQRLLESDALSEADRGRNRRTTFGTDAQRSFLRRLFSPVPEATDNANVNVVPWQGQWLAMTEGPHQHRIDHESLRSLGHYRYEDDLPRGMIMSAHPHYDAGIKSLVNVGTVFGPSSALHVFHQGKDQKRREIEGTLKLKRAPYLHSFGLTPRHAVLVDHPLRVNPVRMLFSNKAFIRHFTWDAKDSTKLWLLDRRQGTFRCYETDPLFCFHTVNAFEDGEDVILDFLAYPDASPIDALYADVLLEKLPDFRPRLLRARLTPAATTAKLEPLADVEFEFPQIAYQRCHGQRERYVWGTALYPREPDLFRSEIVKVDTARGEVRRFDQDELSYGEPVFVPRPGAVDEDDGVLLAVGSDADAERSRLLVLSASSLEPIARCDLALNIPLGFHGNFAPLETSATA